MNDQPTEGHTTPEQPAFNQEKFEEALNQRFTEMAAEQSVAKALIFGVVAAIVGALLWAALAVVTGMQIGYAAIGLGFLVGFAVRYGGKGLTPVYGVIGALLGVASCVIGNYFTTIAVVSSESGASYMELAKALPIGTFITLLLENLEPMDYLFFGLAGYFGYKCANRSLDEEEIATIQQQSQQ